MSFAAVVFSAEGWGSRCPTLGGGREAAAISPLSCVSSLRFPLSLVTDDDDEADDEEDESNA